MAKREWKQLGRERKRKERKGKEREKGEWNLEGVCVTGFRGINIPADWQSMTVCNVHSLSDGCDA